MQMDLQLFAHQDGEERREDPTPRRRRKARREGQVLQSKELVTAGALVCTFAALWVAFPFMGERVQRLATEALSLGANDDWGAREGYDLLVTSMTQAAVVTAPVLAAAVVAGVGVTLMQTGIVFSTKPLSPDLGRIDPIKGAARVFSLRAIANLIKSLLKVTAVGWVAYVTLAGHIAEFPLYLHLPLSTALARTAAILQVLLLRCFLVFVVVGAADFVYERSEHEKKLKMTRRELKEELKESEGDPQTHSRRRSLRQQVARQRMITAVPGADVVISNPTHFAVALQYEFGEMDAPLVVARGRGLMAQRIREAAAEHGVPVEERPPLARALYDMSEVGQYIPPQLYEAVAEVLAYVYRAQGRSTMEGGRRQ